MMVLNIKTRFKAGKKAYWQLKDLKGARFGVEMKDEAEERGSVEASNSSASMPLGVYEAEAKGLSGRLCSKLQQNKNNQNFNFRSQLQYVHEEP